MEIISGEREEINFNKWMENVKDSYGFVTWGYMYAWN
jgi:hypothetical protein